MQSFHNSAYIGCSSGPPTLDDYDTSCLTPASPMAVDSCNSQTSPAFKQSVTQPHNVFLGVPHSEDDSTSPFDSSSFNSGTTYSAYKPSRYFSDSDGSSSLSTDELCRSFIPHNSPLAEMAFEPTSEPVPTFLFNHHKPILSHSPNSPAMSVDSPALYTPASAAPVVSSKGDSQATSSLQPSGAGLGLTSAFEQQCQQPVIQEEQGRNSPKPDISGWQPDQSDSLMSVDISFNVPTSLTVDPSVLHRPVKQEQVYTSSSKSSIQDVTMHSVNSSLSSIPPPIDNESHAAAQRLEDHSSPNSLPQTLLPTSLEQSTAVTIPEIPASKYSSPHANPSVLGCVSNTIGQSPSRSVHAQGQAHESTPASASLNISTQDTPPSPDPDILQPKPVSFTLSESAASDLLSSLEAGTLEKSKVVTSAAKNANAKSRATKSGGGKRRKSGKVSPRERQTLVETVPTTELKPASPPLPPPSLPPSHPPSLPPIITHHPRLPSRVPAALRTPFFTHPHQWPASNTLVTHDTPTPISTTTTVAATTGPRARNIRTFVPLALAKRITQEAMRELEREREAERRRMEEKEREEEMEQEQDQGGRGERGEVGRGDGVGVGVGGQILVWSKSGVSPSPRKSGGADAQIIATGSTSRVLEFRLGEGECESSVASRSRPSKPKKAKASLVAPSFQRSEADGDGQNEFVMCTPSRAGGALSPLHNTTVVSSTQQQQQQLFLPVSPEPTPPRHRLDLGFSPRYVAPYSPAYQPPGAVNSANSASPSHVPGGVGGSPISNILATPTKESHTALPVELSMFLTGPRTAPAPNSLPQIPPYAMQSYSHSGVSWAQASSAGNYHPATPSGLRSTHSVSAMNANFTPLQVPPRAIVHSGRRDNEGGYGQGSMSAERGAASCQAGETSDRKRATDIEDGEEGEMRPGEGYVGRGAKRARIC